jgi:hypothetical protein
MAIIINCMDGQITIEARLTLHLYGTSSTILPGDGRRRGGDGTTLPMIMRLLPFVPREVLIKPLFLLLAVKIQSIGLNQWDVHQHRYRGPSMNAAVVDADGACRFAMTGECVISRHLNRRQVDVALEPSTCHQRTSRSSLSGRVALTCSSGSRGLPLRRSY